MFGLQSIALYSYQDSHGVTYWTPDQKFAFDFPISAKLVGRPRVTIAIEVDRTTAVGTDSRTFGLIFGTFTIK